MSSDQFSTGPTVITPVQVVPPGLEALLRLPSNPVGVVAFAHGGGSGRLSPRNNHVADALAAARIASVLLDLLTESEATDRRNVFDVQLLAERLGSTIDWLRRDSRTSALPIGLFGASTGAAAALIAAANAPDTVVTVVSRGGRPDLAGEALQRVTAPTLLIVGGSDQDVLALNRTAMTRMRCERTLQIVPGATHLFEEPGALESVVWLSCQWFLTRMALT